MSWSPSESLNPEFLRALRATLPRRRAVFVAGLTLAALAAGAWVVWNKSAPPDYNSAYDGNPLVVAERHARQVLVFGASAFGALTVALFALLFLLGPALAGLSFVQERLRGTAAFQQMTLLSPFRLAVGKFWGAGALAYFVALMLVPCALVSAWLGDVNPNEVARLYLFLLVGGLCWQAVGLYVSAALAGQSERQLRGGLLVGPLVAVGGAVTAIGLNWFFRADYEMMASHLSEGTTSYYLYTQYKAYWWHFYGARVPAYAVLLGLLTFAGVWAFAGAVRRVKLWQLIPTSPQAAWYFFLTAAALVVGLLWGRHVDDTEPVERLQIYMLLCWAAAALFAGGSALTRGRLREWWSAGRDPLALLRRSEIRGAVETLVFIVSTSLVGLFALWFSYHVDPPGNRFDYNFGSQFLPVALCFALTLAATVFFVQFCAMFRFRIGGWAGVALLVVFYAFAGVAGMMLEGQANTATLVNPVAYSEVVTKGDYFMSSTFDSEPLYDRDAARLAGPSSSEVVNYYYRQKVSMPKDYTYTPSDPAVYGTGATLRGLAVEGALALLCFSLLLFKWGRTRREMLREGAA